MDVSKQTASWGFMTLLCSQCVNTVHIYERLFLSLCGRETISLQVMFTLICKKKKIVVNIFVQT